MAAIVLLGAAFIFLVNGAFMLGKIEGKGAAAPNAVIGTLIAILSLLIAWGAKDAGTYIVAGLAMTFSIFYLTLAWGLFGGHDLRGVGWYCLAAAIFVAFTAVFYATVPDLRFFLFAVAWAILFFLAFLAMALGASLAKLIGWLLIIESVVTLMYPAFLILAQWW